MNEPPRNVLQFETAKKGIAWFWRQRAHRFGQAQNIGGSGVRMSVEETERCNRTYAEMVKCMDQKDPADDDDLHPILARAAVLTSVGSGKDQQNEADRTFAPDIIEWSARYAGRGLSIVQKRMERRGLLKPKEG